MDEFDLNGYDPFNPIYMLEVDGSEQIDSEPMEDYNWEEWLDRISLDV